MTPISTARLQVEALWLARLKAAARRYNDATAHYDSVLSNQNGAQFHSGETAHSLWQAAVERNEARREFQHVLHTFTRLVVDGRVPPAED